MPTYEYACKSCGEHLEVAQSFKDATLTECPACGGTLRKVFQPIGIAFKGSGFYKNDSRAASSKSAGSKSSEGSKAAASSGSDGGGTTGDAKGASEPKSGAAAASSDKSSSAAAS